MKVTFRIQYLIAVLLCICDHGAAASAAASAALAVKTAASAAASAALAVKTAKELSHQLGAVSEGVDDLELPSGKDLGKRVRGFVDGIKKEATDFAKAVRGPSPEPDLSQGSPPRASPEPAELPSSGASPVAAVSSANQSDRSVSPRSVSPSFSAVLQGAGLVARDAAATVGQAAATIGNAAGTAGTYVVNSSHGKVTGKNFVCSDVEKADKPGRYAALCQGTRSRWGENCYFCPNEGGHKDSVDFRNFENKCVADKYFCTMNNRSTKEELIAGKYGPGPPEPKRHYTTQSNAKRYLAAFQNWHNWLFHKMGLEEQKINYCNLVPLFETVVEEKEVIHHRISADVCSLTTKYTGEHCYYCGDCGGVDARGYPGKKNMCVGDRKFCFCPEDDNDPSFNRFCTCGKEARGTLKISPQTLAADISAAAAAGGGVEPAAAAIRPAGHTSSFGRFRPLVPEAFSGGAAAAGGGGEPAAAARRVAAQPTEEVEEEVRRVMEQLITAVEQTGITPSTMFFRPVEPEPFSRGP